MINYKELPKVWNPKVITSYFYTEYEEVIDTYWHGLPEDIKDLKKSKHKVPKALDDFTTLHYELKKFIKAKFKVDMSFGKFVQQFVFNNRDEFIKVGNDIFGGKSVRKKDLTFVQVKFILMLESLTLWMYTTEPVLDHLNGLVSLTEFPKLILKNMQDPKQRVYNRRKLNDDLVKSIEQMRVMSYLLIKEFLSIDDPSSYFGKMPNKIVTSNNYELLFGSSRDNFILPGVALPSLKLPKIKVGGRSLQVGYGPGYTTYSITKERYAAIHDILIQAFDADPVSHDMLENMIKLEFNK